MTKATLTIAQAQRVFDTFFEGFSNDSVAWINAPEFAEGNFQHTSGWGDSATTSVITPQEALDIYKRKTDGAYTERCGLFLAQLPVIVANGYDVALVQFAAHDGAPFDSTGWMVTIVEGMPIYHLAPWDLDSNQIKDLVVVVGDNSDPRYSWKGTNKKGELIALNTALTRKKDESVDLVAIAQEFSN